MRDINKVCNKDGHCISLLNMYRLWESDLKLLPEFQTSADFMGRKGTNKTVFEMRSQYHGEQIKCMVVVMNTKHTKITEK